MKVRFSAAAELKLTEVVIYNEELPPGLGTTFRESMDKVLGVIAKLTFLGHAYNPAFRRIQLRRFHHWLVYVVESDQLTMLDLLHQAQAPDSLP